MKLREILDKTKTQISLKKAQQEIVDSVMEKMVKHNGGYVLNGMYISEDEQEARKWVCELLGIDE